MIASEVKSLASQSAKATEEISEPVADILKAAGEAIAAIKTIGGITPQASLPGHHRDARHSHPKDGHDDIVAPATIAMELALQLF